MKSTFISREINTINMEMEVTAEEFEAAINEVFQKNRKYFAVPGFRKGKAPRRIIENNYGKDVFIEEAVSVVFNKFYSDALDELGYEPVDHPDIDLEGQEIESGKGINFKVKFVTEPEVKIEKYKGIEVEAPRAEVTDADVESQLKSYATRNARLLSVDREAAEGDTVVFDYAGFIGEEQFEGGTAENSNLKLGSKNFIPGFEEQLIGVKAGDEKDIEVPFPIDYPVEKLAGELAVFKCKIHEIKEEELPEIDDDFAKECSEFDTLEEWKADLKERLAVGKASTRRTNIKNAALDKLMMAAVIDIPECMIENEIDDLLKQFDQQLSYSGQNLQAYLQETKTEMTQFREQIRMEAERKVKGRLVIAEIAKQEGIDATDDEVTEELRSMGIQYGMDAEQMREVVGKDIKYIKKDVIAKKALEVVADHAVVTDLDLSSN